MLPKARKANAAFSEEKDPGRRYNKKDFFLRVDQRRSKLPAPAKRSFCAAFFKKRLLA
jgi:hypothetical protein